MKKLVLLFVLVALATTGCFWRTEVQTSEVGLVLLDGVSVDRVEQSGRYTDWGYYSELVIIDVANITTDWGDPSLVTSDKQPISLALKLTFGRSRIEADIQEMFNNYRSESRNNDTLVALVHSRVPSVAKAITTKYTLDQMLGIAEGDDAVGREVVEAELHTLLETELAKIGVRLEKAAIADIGVDQSFLDALTAKAQASIESEIAQARTLQLAEQLLQEQAQTEISVELAQRQNRVNEELAKAYADNPELFELRKLELLSQLLDENDLVIYVPEGSDIATVLGNSGGVVPVP